jgi:hypothetical protein
MHRVVTLPEYERGVICQGQLACLNVGKVGLVQKGDEAASDEAQRRLKLKRCAARVASGTRSRSLASCVHHTNWQARCLAYQMNNSLSCYYTFKYVDSRFRELCMLRSFIESYTRFRARHSEWAASDLVRVGGSHG